MKWIKYRVLQGIVDNEEVFTNKKIGYNYENLTIATQEAYDGYTIEEDDEVFEQEPLPVRFGGTGATDKLGFFKSIGFCQVEGMAKIFSSDFEKRKLPYPEAEAPGQHPGHNLTVLRPISVSYESAEDMQGVGSRRMVIGTHPSLGNNVVVSVFFKNDYWYFKAVNVLTGEEVTNDDGWAYRGIFRCSYDPSKGYGT